MGVLAFLTINQTEWRPSRRPMNSRVVHKTQVRQHRIPCLWVRHHIVISPSQLSTFGFVWQSRGYINCQESAHHLDQFTAKELSLVRTQSLGSSKLQTQCSTIASATSDASVDTRGTAIAYIVNMSVITNTCFALVRVAIVIGPNMSAAIVLNLIPGSNGA